VVCRASNGPYRDGKGSLYEGGTRVAALANWPERIKPLDGINLWPALREGKPSPRRDMVFASARRPCEIARKRLADAYQLPGSAV